MDEGREDVGGFVDEVVEEEVEGGRTRVTIPDDADDVALSGVVVAMVLVVDEDGKEAVA